MGDYEVPSDLKELSTYLEVLKLPLNKVPTVEGLRKAYKAFFKLHPDKKGDSFTSIFQEVTLAVRMISLYLADNTDHKEASIDSTNKEDDKALL